jgi:Fe-S oxidoreductase
MCDVSMLAFWIWSVMESDLTAAGYSAADDFDLVTCAAYTCTGNFGGGGGLPLSNPGVSREIAKSKVRQFQELSGQILATACPMCERMLGRTGKEAGIMVRDIISLIAERID